MFKKEAIYLQILEGFFAARQLRFTQSAISQKAHVSIGLVNRAVEELEGIGAVERAGRGFSLVDAKKLLAFFATKRKLSSDIAWRALVNEGVREMERGMPPSACFTAYSAYRLKFNEAPSDYGKVYVYGERKEIEGRFAVQRGGAPNLFVLKKPRFLKGGIAPMSLVYADLWNLPDWFAQEYLKELEKRLFKE